MAPTKTGVEVEGRQLVLTNLDKVLYPDVGFTKGEVIDYYARIAPVLLPHLAGRALTRKRYPDGVDSTPFFEKNAPRHTPDWVRTVVVPSPGSTKDRETVNYVVVEGLPTLVWLANLAALELHVPQWTVGPRGAIHDSDLLVLDLDPGPPATVVECCQVALLLREVLARPEYGGLQAWAKTSGSKGLQLYVPIAPQPGEKTSAYAKKLAECLEREHPELIVSRMTKALRPGKVLIDWSQNNAAKTTVAPYSLRAREAPTVSTPVTWAEVEACDSPQDLRFTAADVLERVDRSGDLFAPLLELRQRLPAPPG
ncbi:non-homologous end-joining DNA ligase [Motilibacter deserti]|uniref:ATP-dependent DNA ligase n=1 Tax=Motilibacter deserti TaxID=2714956 RepID=A0ABX0GUE8_9ACTN|nr:ATP-dependent DNA ligase [Motilibacter deserti]